MIFILFFI